MKVYRFRQTGTGRNYRVAGPLGVSKDGFETVSVAQSYALTKTTQAKRQGLSEATYYIRDEDGETVGFVELISNGDILVHGAHSLRV